MLEIRYADFFENMFTEARDYLHFISLRAGQVGAKLVFLGASKVKNKSGFRMILGPKEKSKTDLSKRCSFKKKWYRKVLLCSLRADQYLFSRRPGQGEI